MEKYKQKLLQLVNTEWLVVILWFGPGIEDFLWFGNKIVNTESRLPTISITRFDIS